MKKVLGILLAVSIACSQVSALAANETTFSDISASKYAWAKPYIEEMTKNGYITGFEDNTYRPDNQVTKLDTILLFARAMGSNQASNADIIEIALEQYADLIESTGIRYGKNEVSYMLYRGALTEADVKKFLSNGNYEKPMSRQEACAIITKALCADKEAEDEVLIDMEYTDAKLISADYANYVYYVSKQGIMNGMDDGTFSPEASVLRSQIAKMLYHTVDKINLYIETVLVPFVETDVNNMTILDNENEEFKFGYKDSTKFFSNGKIISDEEFVNSSRAMLTYIDNSLVFVDMYDRVVDETIKGIYQGASTDEGVTTITVKPSSSKNTVEYKVLSGAEVLNVDGAKVSFKNIAAGSYVELELTNNKIIKLTQLNKDSFIRGAIVANVEIDDELYLTISHDEKEYDGMKFLLNDSVAVYKNDDLEDLSKIYKGDKVDITMEYGEVTKLKAYSNTKTYEGTINEIVLSSNPQIKIKSGSDIISLSVSTDVKVKINGEDATLNDLKIGDRIKATAESENILSIQTTAAAVSTSKIEGVIETVNLSRGFIKVNGETIFCNVATTTVVDASGEIKTVKSLVGDGTMEVSVRGSINNGAYTATLIVIE